MLLLVTSGTISTAAATAAAASLRILCAIQQRKRTAVMRARKAVTNMVNLVDGNKYILPT